jgi:hypothetical protein
LRASIVLCLCLLCGSLGLLAQGTLADYQRAQGLQEKARGLVVNSPGAIHWIGDSDRFWYPRTVGGGTEFVLVDTKAETKNPAFDHDKLAAAISTATGHTYKALALPFAPAPAGRGGTGTGAAAAGFFFSPPPPKPAEKSPPPPPRPDRPRPSLFSMTKRRFPSARAARSTNAL